jgi:signal peptidase I
MKVGDLVRVKQSPYSVITGIVVRVAPLRDEPGHQLCEVKSPKTGRRTHALSRDVEVISASR